MKNRTLGRTGLTAGAVGLGCMGMTWAYDSGDRDEQESLAVLARAVELGVTLIDTADMYGPFTNEELVGRGLAGRREQVVLATKCGNVVDPGDRTKITQDGRPEHVRAACDASLRRLRTDVIDLYQLHRVDPTVPIEDTWGAFAELVQAGKVLHTGLSEVTVDQLDRAEAVHPVASVQSELSLWTRDPLRNGVLAWCAAHDAAFLPFSPLGRGYLTGALTAGFGADDFRSRLPRFTAEAMGANQHLVDTVRAVAERSGATPAQVAIAWTLAQGDAVVPIPGTKKLRYLEQNAAAGDLVLGAGDLAELDALPDPVGTRY